MPRAKPPAATLQSGSPDEIEAQFYEALQHGDITRLMGVWADDDDIVCVHPGGPRLIGAAAIRASFEAIFSNGAIPVQPDQIHRLNGLGCAVHHLVERITVPSDTGDTLAWTLATNVYVKTPLGWRMAAHHASPGSMEEPPPPHEAPTTLH